MSEIESAVYEAIVNSVDAPSFLKALDGAGLAVVRQVDANREWNSAITAARMIAEDCDRIFVADAISRLVRP